MFGWEFPPFNSGGLGTACYGLTRGLSREGAKVTFVIPRNANADYGFLKLIAANIKVKLLGVKSALNAYATSQDYAEQLANVKSKADAAFYIYGRNLFEEVERYAKKAAEIAAEEPHEVIHAHEWLTFKAGIAAKKVSGKPLIVHVHATEFDRTGGTGLNQRVYDIERAGMHAADAVIAVSNYTKNKIVQHYGISPDKVSVVHNAIDAERNASQISSKSGKTVLYLGRVTLQKGPDYFIEAAKRVLEKEPDARFIVAGSGDMEGKVIEKAARLGISDKVFFTGFLRKHDIAKAYSMASLYVMPSVSEPFGLTPLEAAINRTPVLISKQSGVSEVFKNCLRVDFWNIDEMANKIIAVLRHNELQQSLTENGYSEVSAMSWNNAARKCVQIYSSLLK
ncbi:glycosyltransferase family 4 protein [Candidatus Woesearchaeota archaeon]|nr:glycosyltransferase family 4 protein [Candidatus Woesearchaeota archaeon]